MATHTNQETIYRCIKSIDSHQCPTSHLATELNYFPSTVVLSYDVDSSAVTKLEQLV